MARRRVLLGVVAAGLGGCGFELRRAPDLDFRTVQLRGFAPHSPLADELRRRIDASRGTRVVDSVAQAEAVLEALADTRQRTVVASTAAGQVRELRLRTRLRFTLYTPDERMLIPPTEIVQSRDMSYSESAALAKQQEEAFLFRSMQGDIVSQVIRRLAAVHFEAPR